MEKPLLSKDEQIKSSSIYLGYIVLKELQNSANGKISIYDLIELLRKKNGIVHYRQLLFALIFLYTSGVVDFSEPYIYKL